ncbi:MAG: glycerophosphodiester phosphodiesterase family protein [Planctomycetota bacterium]|nr:glycerophosphodiester phosphodiesterase family protein [Planctomycetota bacterium]
MKIPLIIAHRGASQQAPENTLPALEKARDAGVDMLALEVQRSKDDQPLVLADVSLDRTTNGTGRVARMTAAEVQALDAGSWFGAAFAGAKVPLLGEALQAAGSKVRVMLSLPETRSGTPWVKQLQAGLQGRADPAGDVLVFSDSESLKSFREAAPGFSFSLALGEKVDGWLYLEKADKMGLKVIRPYRAQIDSVLVRQAHAKNIQVYAYFANEEEDLRELLDLRVDGIVTGRPERLRKLLDGMKEA